MSKKILITGAAGFVGRRLVKVMLDKGYNVVCVDNIAPLTGAIDPNQGWHCIILKIIKILIFIILTVEIGLIKI